MDVNSSVNIRGPQSSRAVVGFPALSEVVQVLHHCPIGLHVLVLGDAVVVPAQSPDRVPIGAGEYNIWKNQEENGSCDAEDV